MGLITPNPVKCKENYDTVASLGSLFRNLRATKWLKHPNDVLVRAACGNYGVGAGKENIHLHLAHETKRSVIASTRIEEEDRTRPLTDDQITSLLQGQGIDVTRRTVAKYREDMKIPSTHQRRMRK